MSETRIEKILITGGDGYVGSNLCSFLKELGYTVYPCVFSSKGLKNEVVLDITNSDAVIKIINEVQPDLVIHTAGLSSLGECEKNQAKADLINFVGTKNIVDSINKKTKLIFFSSDYVFDGEKGDYKETDAANPKTVYGQTKLKAEKYITDNLKDYIIVRTANIFGRGGNFFNFVVNSLLANESIEVYDNVAFTPTQIDYLIDSLYRLISIDFKGIIHIAGKDKLTRYGFALKIAEELGKDKSLIKRSSQAEDGLISRDSSLNTSLLDQTIKLYSPTISEAIHTVVNNQNNPYLKFQDDRGEVLGICQGHIWQEINYIESKKGSIRGNHYHKKTIEKFYIIDGKIEVTLKGLVDNSVEVFIAQKGDIFTVNPNTLHSFSSLTDAKWINMLSKPMTDEDFHKI